jgi:hypothetical protein
MGFLQGIILSNGKELKLSFTRSRIKNNKGLQNLSFSPSN